MTFLPIVERELRVASRRPATHGLRSATAGLAIGLVLLLTLITPARMPAHELGRLLFQWEAALAFAFCLFAGAFLSADCLSFEKREGTLGLLFLTDLRGYDLVLGKLSSTSVQAVYALAALFPILALPLLMGGVTGGEFARVVAVLLMTILLSLAVGMLVSALGRDSRTTLLVSLGALVLLGGLSPVLMFLQLVLAQRSSWVEGWLLGTPAGALIWAYDASYHRGYRLLFWGAYGGFGALALGALVLASLAIPRARQEKVAARGASRCHRWWQRLRWGDPAHRSQQRSVRETHPFQWLCGRDHLGRVLAWGVVLFLGGAWLCFFVAACGGRRDSREAAFALSLPLAFVLHAGLKAVVALEAGRRFSEDKQSGALELLLATPLSAQRIVQGQWLALRRHFRGPLLALLAVNAVSFWVLAVVNRIELPSTARWFLGQAFVLGAAALLVDFHALSWLGMLQGLRSRRHNRAVLVTLARILLVPWLGVILFILLMVVVGGVRDNHLPGYALLWFGIGFGISGLQAAWARGELRARLRELVSEGRTAARGTLRLMPAGPVVRPARAPGSAA